MKNLLLIAFVLISAFLSAQSWNSIGDLPNSGRYDDIVFADELNGWCVNSGGEVYHTTDGGFTWGLQYVTPHPYQYMRAIDFLDDQIGVAGSLDGVHLKTTDGGLTWNEFQDDIPGSTPGLCGLSHAGQHFFGVGAYYNPAYFIHSPDAGETWEWTDMSDYADGLVGCHFVNEEIGFVGGIIESVGSVILKTMDGGDTWTEVYSTSGGTEYVWKFFQVSEQVIFASIESWILPGTFIAKSIDGGDTWQQHQVSDQVLDIQGIGFENEFHGWVGPRNQPLYETLDGGVTWTEGNGPNNINRFFRTEEGTMFASGSIIYQYDESTGLTSNQILGMPSISINPNPVERSMSVSLELFQSSMVILDMYTSQGQLLKSILHERLLAGPHTFNPDVSHLATGTYFLSMRTNEGFQALKFVKE